MKRRIIWSLAVLNVALLAALVWRYTGENAALAQQNRHPAEIVMIPGRLNTGNVAVVYLVDPSNHQLSAMSYTVQGDRVHGTTRGP